MSVKQYLVLARDVAMLTLISAFFLAQPAHAYVDPGSGSVIVTTILGVMAAIGYTTRKYFYKIRRKIFGKPKDEDR